MKMNCVIISGGRDFKGDSSAALLNDKCLDFFHENGFKNGEVTIFHGDCVGADHLGQAFAIEHEIPYTPFPATWDDLTATPCLIKTRKNGTKYNAIAGLNRNMEMAENATHCICFWDGRSPGTANMIKCAKSKGLVLKIVRY